MERQQFNKLVQVLQNDTVFQNKGNKPQAPVEFQLVIFLRRLGSKDDILSICSRFGICEGTVILYINHVMKAIRNKKLEFVQWPKNKSCYCSCRDSFYFKLGTCTRSNSIFYKKYAINCQGIVDFKGIFINYIIGWPGSVHDARVYANSDFFLNTAKYIEGDDYVLGDSAYPISSFLITPFKNPFNH
ncbi:hypothetical protein RhiirA5_301501 [Rhizophagus irregularis]|uniref:DDE Tnp4 domain-containing protein n=2 Tax=Rhizophagus irregularis TaxID=588596 RepID=A0A2N0NQR2_9GLOM|nr:hypothetical protein RhiirA5_302105 [Rhizophagus irregularis]PKB97868.1 hypothetical protein RhiirA5_301501 [Rhizophagus irregularis]